MTIVQPSAGGAAGRPSSSGGGLADVIDTILDKGLVIDAYVSVSLVGIELLTINARVVVASVDTYLRFAQAVNRLDLSEQQKGLPEVMQDMTQGVAKGKTKGVAQGALEAAGDKLREFAAGEEDEEPVPRRRRRSREEY
ncbi:putative gas vesicle structural protein 1 [Sphaerisporangium rufum]|uniref:Gas vesicle protein A n=1 Tax=Sphaerisporangium rufum TaxID=1381558 RepID=A0A919R3S3_9ACTN|nr:gas vesicle protein GvpJ [Sphaerisporangium rufum]GII79157.1 putative gas vesicle structural protein 1 [Sphaerisporangium rufum]